MEKESTYKIIALILLILLFFSNSNSRSLKKEKLILEDQLSEYESALSEANDNIEEANSIIEDAQSYAWSDYDEMGYALDNLETVDTVYGP